jgi:predicted transport protein
MKGGFADSPLRMNQGLAKLDRWTEDSIKSRAGTLAGRAVGVWQGPSLPADVLESYKPMAGSVRYTIDDHPYLSVGPMRALFEAFRKQVLALDPCVAEDFLKLYVAFKAETNFVDVIPQAKRLLLVLNMAFPEITDPKGICRDVSSMGRWGNGDVEVGLASIDELPYVMGLVRQSLEKQMGNGAGA